MKIIEEPITIETVQKYKDELFLFNEEMEYLQNKRIVKLINDNGQLVAISMYTYKMDKEDVELYLSAEQEKYKDKLCNSIYLDSVSSIAHTGGVVNTILNYIKSKYNKGVWLYSSIYKIRYWNNRKDFLGIGENIFISC